MAQQRLQKILAAAGIDSRRNCEQLILDGAVRVNRKLVDTLPAFADSEKDLITVNGKRIQAEKKVYYLLNKPRGVICTNKDPSGRKRAIDIVKARERVFCVGRLDVDTTGLIVITNDSELANRLTHPSFDLPKKYIVRVAGKIDPRAIEKLKKGVWLSEGRTAKAAVKVLKRGREESLIEMTIRQGLNRQVRRMCAAVGFSAKSLKRSNIGRIDAKGIGVGKYRRLTAAEVRYLRKATSD